MSSGEIEEHARGRDRTGYSYPSTLHGTADFGLSLADKTSFGVGPVPAWGGISKRHLQDLSEMKGMAVGALGNLLAATETIRDHQPVWGCLANGWEQFKFADRHGDVVFVLLKPKGSRHSATARCGKLVIDHHSAQY